MHAGIASVQSSSILGMMDLIFCTEARPQCTMFATSEKVYASRRINSHHGQAYLQ